MTDAMTSDNERLADEIEASDGLFTMHGDKPCQLGIRQSAEVIAALRAASVKAGEVVAWRYRWDFEKDWSATTDARRLPNSDDGDLEIQPLYAAPTASVGAMQEALGAGNSPAAKAARQALATPPAPTPSAARERILALVDELLQADTEFENAYPSESKTALEALDTARSRLEAALTALLPDAAATDDPLDDLVQRFSVALLEKLKTAREKYGFRGELWRETDWEKDCQQNLLSHLAKGDPRDVAAYCAFMWHHGWSTVAPGEAAIRAAAFDFHAHLQRQREWSERTFGPGPRTKGVCDHIRKELTEIEAAPGDIEEWIDVVILALDGAWRAGATPEAIIAQIVGKQTKNESRNWPDWRTADPDKAIEHVRDAAAIRAAGEK
jgi:hypothetical protein